MNTATTTKPNQVTLQSMSPSEEALLANALEAYAMKQIEDARQLQKFIKP
jgi:hypothetical protein